MASSADCRNRSASFMTVSCLGVTLVASLPTKPLPTGRGCLCKICSLAQYSIRNEGPPYRLKATATRQRGPPTETAYLNFTTAVSMC